MFPFLKKGKDGRKPIIPDASLPIAKSARPDLTQSGLAERKPVKASVDEGFLVQEVSVEIAPEVEEAVMLYANGLIAEATVTLQLCLEQPDLKQPDSTQPWAQPWHALFDLYEATDQREPYDVLALAYAVRFERSPPTWHPVTSRPRATGVQNPLSFSFGANPANDERARLDRFLAESQTAHLVVLDFSKAAVPTDAGQAENPLRCLSQLNATGTSVQLLGGEAYVVRLNAARAHDSLAEAGWLVLMLLLQLLGKAEDFDAVALEYAVRFEISPPSYTPPKRVAAQEVAGDAMPPAGNLFPMPALVGPAASTIFSELQAFAATQRAVVIDLSQVRRIEFSAVGLLMETVVKLAKSGKRLVFRDANEMVNLLLQLIGAGQYARIQPRERK